MGFKRFVNIVEVVVGITALAFVIALFANEPGGESGTTKSTGASIYAASCATCHGDAGQGGVGPALAGKVVEDFPDPGGPDRRRHERTRRHAVVRGRPHDRADRAGRRVHTHRPRQLAADPHAPRHTHPDRGAARLPAGRRRCRDGGRAAPRHRRGDSARAGSIATSSSCSGRWPGSRSGASTRSPPASASWQTRVVCSWSGRRSATTR